MSEGFQLRSRAELDAEPRVAQFEVIHVAHANITVRQSFPAEVLYPASHTPCRHCGSTTYVLTDRGREQIRAALGQKRASRPGDYVCIRDGRLIE